MVGNSKVIAHNRNNFRVQSTYMEVQSAQHYYVGYVSGQGAGLLRGEPFLFGNINGGEHRFCLLRFQYVIDGDNGRNVAFLRWRCRQSKTPRAVLSFAQKMAEEVLLVVR